MITPTTEVQYRPVQAQMLAEWLSRNASDKLWSVDGDDRLASSLDFPCPTDELAEVLRSMNMIIQVQAPSMIDKLTLSNLDRAIFRIPASPEATEATLMSFNLYWEDQTQDDSWILSEDLIEEI
jgi:hypothetical protein